MTPYGRSLSREVLSTWGKEEETAFAYQFKEPPEWLVPGGDVRSVYIYRKNPRLEEGRWILMQADLEAYANIQDKWYIGGTLGFEREKRGAVYAERGVFRRHYVNYRPTDTLSLRAGKFQHGFGINLPDHIIVTKRGLGWDQDMETYNLEAAYLGENWNHYVTGIFGRIDDSTLVRDKGFAWTTSYAFLERFKVGFSYFYGSRQGTRRHVFGPWAIIGFTNRFYLLTETDFESKDPRRAARNATKTRGIVTYNRLGYEIFQGFHVFFAEELSFLSLQNSATRAWGHTLGAQWFPRPHLDVQIAWQKALTAQFRGRYTDFAWAQFHFYF